jgi:hypothetical protein
MLARRRSLKFKGVEIERTPLLVPSFSSKGFPEVTEILQYCSELIVGPILISAYDLHYQTINPPFDFASLIFLDSGGYEASKDLDLSDTGERDHTPEKWTPEFHRDVVNAWNPLVPSVLISYDHPAERLPIAGQIRRARKAATARPDMLHEILLKPETPGSKRVKVESIRRHIRAIGEFDAIGITEKEIGSSLLERMKNIALLRMALERAGIDKPLHVFGSLDTITSSLYFLAGADIFDGLTWLRYAFDEGSTLYKQNYGATLPLDTKLHVLDGICWNKNYRYLQGLQEEMRRFLGTGSFESFKFHGERLRKALETVLEEIGDGDGNKQSTKNIHQGTTTRKASGTRTKGRGKNRRSGVRRAAGRRARGVSRQGKRSRR